MMPFYILVYSLAALALVVALLMHWPRLHDKDKRQNTRKKRT